MHTYTICFIIQDETNYHSTNKSGSDERLKRNTKKLKMHKLKRNNNQITIH